MAVSWTKDMRERAKRDGKRLIALAVDGRLAQPPSGQLVFWGPATEEEAAKVEALLLQIIRGRDGGNGGRAIIPD